VVKTTTGVVLHVDDDPVVRGVVARMLAGHVSRVVQAGNAEEALDAVGRLEIDLLLLDVNLPGLSGLELCRSIKAAPATRHIPVILLTGLGSSSDIADGFEAGADEFLTKPVSGLELRVRVHSMLRVKRQHDEMQSSARLRENLVSLLVSELRSPLNAISSRSEQLLGLPSVVGGERATLEEIATQSSCLTTLFNDLLLVARLEAGENPMQQLEVNLVEVLQAVERRCTTKVEERQLELRFELPEGRELPLVGDPGVLTRVVEHLIDNAIAVSPPASTVRVALEYEPRGGTREQAAPVVRLLVCDEGPDIFPEHRARAFDRLEVLRRRVDGEQQIGISLAYCRLAVAALGGSIEVEDNQPSGARVVVTL